MIREQQIDGKKLPDFDKVRELLRTRRLVHGFRGRRLVHRRLSVEEGGGRPADQASRRSIPAKEEASKKETPKEMPKETLKEMPKEHPRRPPRKCQGDAQG